MNLADLFKVATLTDAINKLPYFDGKVGASGLFTETGVPTTYIAIEENAGRLVLVSNTSRNDDPTPVKKGKRTKRIFEALHLPVAGQLLPSDLQNIAAFGQEDAQTQVINGQAQVINNRLQDLKNSIEATREFGRIGAISGKILDADGSVIYDLYDEFGVTKKTRTIAFSNANTDVRKECVDAKRYSEKKVAGQAPIIKFRSWCGPDFLDALTNHESVKAAFANWQAAQDRLGGDVRNGFVFGGIEFIELDVTVSGQIFIPADTARVVPVGPGIFRTYNAPANYNETVNTMGRPFYSKGEERKMGKGWDLEAQSNPLSLCLFPEALYEMKAG